MVSAAKAIRQQLKGVGYLRFFSHRTLGCNHSRGRRAAIGEIDEGVHEVISVLVFVAMLKRKHLEHHVRQHARYSDWNRRQATVVKASRFDVDFNEVLNCKICSGCIECTEPASGSLFGAVDTA